jgi:hypothetical protein
MSTSVACLSAEGMSLGDQGLNVAPAGCDAEIHSEWHQNATYLLFTTKKGQWLQKVHNGHVKVPEVSSLVGS